MPFTQGNIKMRCIYFPCVKGINNKLILCLCKRLNTGIYYVWSSDIYTMPKGNPNPIITPEFKASQFRRGDDSTEPMAKKNIQLRLTESIDEVVRSLPNRSAWLRRVITEAAQKELIGEEKVHD
jgi:hypothetical protein